MSTAAKKLKEQMHLLPINTPVPNRRVLIIDDEPEIAKGIQRILNPAETKAGTKVRSSRSKATTSNEPLKDEFNVTVVHTPKEAIAAIKQALKENRPYAMGFFDVMLNAEIDGIELVQQVLALDPKIFAVFVTAYHDRNVDAIATFLGEDNAEKWDYINKPFSDGEILQKARNATSLWDLHRLKEWQEERIDLAHQRLLENERFNTAAALIRSVTHEFGNLLTHIIGRAELAKMETDPHAMRRAFDVILKAGNTANDVLRRFNKLSGSSDAGLTMKKEDFSVLLDEAVEIMQFRFRRHAVTVLMQDLPSIEVEVHRSSIIQVLVNLFINALHAMPNGGRLHLSMETKNSNLIVKVRDSGTGIPKDILDKVTEPMFSTKGTEGKGLGLSICKEIIEIDHNGEFTIDNADDGGAVVTLTIPLTQEDAHAQ